MIFLCESCKTEIKNRKTIRETKNEGFYARTTFICLVFKCPNCGKEEKITVDCIYEYFDE